MPRVARIFAIDYPHHVTQRGNNRETVFFDDGDKKFYLKTLSRYSSTWNFDVWAYCLMPNHVHLLIVPRNEESLAKGIGSTNLVYTQYINKRYGRSGRLWQNRFFSTIVAKASYLWSVTRYIERNPIRAKLVEKAEDYRWSSARAHVLGMVDKILSTQSWLTDKDLDGYCDFIRHEDKNVEDSIRKATSIGRPFGDETFIRTIGTILNRDITPRDVGRPRKQKEK